MNSTLATSLAYGWFTAPPSPAKPPTCGGSSNCSSNVWPTAWPGPLATGWSIACPSRSAGSDAAVTARASAARRPRPGAKASLFRLPAAPAAGRAGVILAYELAAANAADTALLFELAPPTGTTGIGDRNYWNPPLQAELAEAGVRLLAPYRTKKHDPDPARSRQLSRPRWRVATVNGQLTDRYRIKRVWSRDPWHLGHRVIRKILSHMVAVWLNIAAGLEPLRFSTNLAA